jgi:hypothetical protein
MYPIYYLYNETDVANAYGPNNAGDATFHYISNGIREGRSPSPFFNPKYYLSQYWDLRNAYGETNYEAARAHWLTYGIGEGRRGSRSFDVKYYLESNQDLLNAFGPGNYVAAFQHWRDVGWSEGRRTASDGHLKLLPFIGEYTSPTYRLVAFTPDGLTTIAWLAISVIQAYVEHANMEKKKALCQELGEGRKRVEAARWMHENDRSNYESEHYEHTRDTMIA